MTRYGVSSHLQLITVIVIGTDYISSKSNYDHDSPFVGILFKSCKVSVWRKTCLWRNPGNKILKNQTSFVMSFPTSLKQIFSIYKIEVSIVWCCWVLNQFKKKCVPHLFISSSVFACIVQLFVQSYINCIIDV